MRATCALQREWNQEREQAKVEQPKTPQEKLAAERLARIQQNLREPALLSA
jgi:hypothetical protein